MSKQIAGGTLSGRVAALVWLSTSVMAAAPAGSSVSFAYPPAPTAGSLTVNTIDSVYAEWTSSYAEAWLYFYCNSGLNGGTQTIFHQPVDTSGNAMVSLAGQSSLEGLENWPTPLRCWFDLNYADKGGQGIGALVVSVTSVAAEATTYSPLSEPTSSSPATTTVATPSATGSQATVVNALPTTTSTNTANNPPASSTPAAANDTTSLPGGAIAGIAIGALAGVGAIAAIAFLLYRRSRKQNNYGSHPDQNYGDEVVKYGHEEKPYGVAVGHVQQHNEPAPGYEAPTYEMQGTDVQELPALQSAEGSLREKRK